MTTYYIKTIHITFPFLSPQNSGTGGLSNDLFLENTVESFPVLSAVNTNPDYTFKFTDQKIFSPCEVNGSGIWDECPAIGLETLTNQDTTGKELSWSDEYELYGGRGFDATAWIAHSWSNPGGAGDADPAPTYDAWLQELVDYFEAAKVGDADWGTDNGEINLYILRYRFTAGNIWSYFPIFYKGNNPLNDETKTPT